MLRYDLVADPRGRPDSIRRPLRQPGSDQGALRRAIVDRYGTCRRRRATPPTSRDPGVDALGETRLPAPTIAPRRNSARARAARRWCSRSIPVTRTVIGLIDIVGAPTVFDASGTSWQRLDLSPGAPFQREALNNGIQNTSRRGGAKATSRRRIVRSRVSADESCGRILKLDCRAGPRGTGRVQRRHAAGDRRADLSRWSARARFDRGSARDRATG